MIKVLVICTNPPWPPDSGAPLRSLGWLRSASTIAEVGLVTISTGRQEEDDLAELKNYCTFVDQVHRIRSPVHKGIDFLLAILSGHPYIVQAARTNRMSKSVELAIEKWQPDIVQAEWIGAAPYLALARQKKIATIYAAHNIEHHVAAAPTQFWRQRLPPFSVETIRKFEISITKTVDSIVTVTQNEKEWFTQFNNNVICLPNAVYPDDYQFILPSNRPQKTIVFVGHLHYPPNIEAVKNIIKLIFPAIQESIPTVRCIIAGRQPSSELLQLAAKNKAIRLLSDVDNIQSIWNQASLFISPLHSGGGSRLKMLEAAACGVPIVSSLFSAKGLALKSNRDYIAASLPSEFAAASLELLHAPDRFDALAKRARNTVLQHHNWNQMAGEQLKLYANIAHNNR